MIASLALGLKFIINIGKLQQRHDRLTLPCIHRVFLPRGSKRDVIAMTSVQPLYWPYSRGLIQCRGGVEGPAGTANAVPLFTVVRIAVPLFKAGRTGAANVPPRMRDCSARAYSTYAWASTVKLILTKAVV